MENCIFCGIIDGKIPAVKVYESERVIAFLDVNPIEKGHVLVVPKRHWQTIAKTSFESEDDIACFEELMYIVRCVAKAVLEIFADGANILQANGLCAGQTVSHLHFHVIPRFGADSARPEWTSGAGKYDSDEERGFYAERISAAVKNIIENEDIL